MQRSPTFAKGWLRMGTACYQLNRVAESLKYFETSLQLDPTNARTKEHIENIKRALQNGAQAGAPAVAQVGAPPAAQAPTASAAPTAPAAAAAPRDQAAAPASSAGAGAKRPAEPRGGADPGPSKKPSPSPAGGEADTNWQAQGAAAYRTGDYASAISLFSRAIVMCGTGGTATLYSNRSAAHAAMKDYEKALADADECVRLHPEWSKGYSRRGNALHGMRRLEEAKTAYEQALRLDPENGVVKRSLQDCDKILRAGPASGAP